VASFSDPEPLGSGHALEGFACGVTALDDWLQEHALAARGAGSARTFVVVDLDQRRVVGYHALTVAEIPHGAAGLRLAKGMPQHPIPAVLLARLAVDRSVQGRGLGTRLLLDAMARTAFAADAVGIRALLVHALNAEARAFYLHHGLAPSPTNERHLTILVKDIRRALEVAARG
jgi:GNAT superfamily N-acetyltransferase